MCGISGYFDLENTVSEEIIHRMNISLKHRGPDDSGIYLSDDKHSALGHTRLSFLDLSPKGKQPLKNNSGNIIISLNGEIYNYLELKNELKNEYRFVTNTDTEVVLAGYQKWGIDVVNKLNGMFAFALLDIQNNSLYLVRDRFGIKPLYYAANDKQLVFASELKAIIATDLIPKEIDYSSFCDYFVYRYIPSPKTIWKDISKIPPAHYLKFDTQNLSCSTVEYWKPDFSSKNQNEKELVEEVDKLLLESVKMHTRADVPIGLFLSGGYDSSALAYYSNRFRYIPKTFSIGFKNWNESEHQYAALVAEKFKFENDFELADENSLQLIDKMPQVYDEPIADISIIPTYMVSGLARKKVKAVMGGEGADEIFGGYTWQKDFYKLINDVTAKEKIKRWFNPIDTVAYYAEAMAMGCFGQNELRELLQPEYHRHIPEDIHWFFRKHFNKKLSPLKSIQYMDMKCFMGEMVLVKIDRASMANSLEVRVPFLNYLLYEKVFSLNERNYFKPDTTKFLLHENIKTNLPEKILSRKKQGFVGPNDYYMNVEWYRSILENSKLAEAGIINREFIADKLNENDYWVLWKLAVMEKWFNEWKN